ncbi:hypothetical protein [Fictibacillus phosphorivorans]|uniref:hypothetical protein n=1 Tax=Fictibacillus phosphorivorans TaxID=1221500 RepID=UPI0035E4F32F
MNKETMIKDMTAKVTEVIDAKDAVLDIVENIEDVVLEGKEKVAQLEAELKAKRDALDTFTDIGEARLAKAEINNLVEDIELQIAVNAGKAKAMHTELEEKAEEFFKVHKSGIFLFRAVDNFFVANTSLLLLQDDKELMSGFASALNASFKAVRQILLDAEIVSQEDQNKSYKGYHLGQRELVTELLTFDSKIRAYAQGLKLAGKL